MTGANIQRHRNLGFFSQVLCQGFLDLLIEDLLVKVEGIFRQAFCGMLVSLPLMWLQLIAKLQYMQIPSLPFLWFFGFLGPKTDFLQLLSAGLDAWTAAVNSTLRQLVRPLDEEELQNSTLRRYV
ncbi:hypothetical protein RJ641_029062 [Dillenia turbinata]|uniref:Uncharacterized protein n=1 Tax=Dillenia turbinata TaxID=194707 RepID=A0AAN8W0L8_9MAGN